MICRKISMGHTTERSSGKRTRTHMRAKCFTFRCEMSKSLIAKSDVFVFISCVFPTSRLKTMHTKERPWYVNPMAFHVIVKLVLNFFLFLCFSVVPSCDSIIGSSSFQSESVKLVCAYVFGIRTLIQ